MKTILTLIGCLLAIPAPLYSQMLIDTTFTWQTYTRQGTLELSIYENDDEEARPHTVVIREVARNEGPSTVADGRHLVELIGRQFAMEPEAVSWIFHWGSFSFPGAQGSKQIFLRATFRRTKTGALSTPSWRVLTREEVEELTGRHYP